LLPAWHHHDVIANGNSAALDASGDNATVIEFVYGLNRQSQRKIAKSWGR
jgi:hypothetical protein